jgi:hypothetical protein
MCFRNFGSGADGDIQRKACGGLNVNIFADIWEIRGDSPYRTIANWLVTGKPI